MVIVLSPLFFCRNYFKADRVPASTGTRQEGAATDEVHFAIQPSAAFIPLYVAKEKFDYTVDITREDIDSLNDTIRFLYKVKQIPEIYDISDYIFR